MSKISYYMRGNPDDHLLIYTLDYTYNLTKLNRYMIINSYLKSIGTLIKKGNKKFYTRKMHNARRS